MDVLGHRVESGLEREVVPEGILSGQAQLRVGIELRRREGCKAADAHSAFDQQRRRDRPAVAEEQRRLQCLLRVELPAFHESVLMQRQELTGHQHVPCSARSVSEVVRAVSCIVEGSLGEPFLDAGIYPVSGHFVEVIVECCTVPVVSGYRHEVEAAAEAAAPFHGHVEIGITESRVPVEGESVPGPVGIGLAGVPVIDLVGDAGVKVAEIRPSSMVVAVLGKHVQQPVGISGAASDQERGLSLRQRTFKVETAGEKTDSERTFNLVGVALASSDVQNRRYAPAEFRRDRALVQFHFADDVGIESREDTEQVRGIVEGSVVEQYEVLVGGASADVESAGCFTHGLDSGEGEDGLDDVSFAEGGRDLGDYSCSHAFETQPRITVVGYRIG